MPDNPGAIIFRRVPATSSGLRPAGSTNSSSASGCSWCTTMSSSTSMATSFVRAVAGPSGRSDTRGSEIMTATFESLSPGDTIDGPKFAVSRESIRLFCDASLDYNPLHLDDDYMKGNLGKTNFGGVIMHGMNIFGLISRMITDWAYPAGAIHRRLETRWLKPVRPGDTIQPSGIVKSKQATVNSRWVLIDVVVSNQNAQKVANGEAMVEFPCNQPVKN